MNKKGKILSFVLTLCFFVPCAFMLSACGSANITGFEVYINDVLVNQTSNNTITLNYGDTLNIEDEIDVKATYDDGTKQNLEVGKGGYSVTGIPTTLNAGTYDISVNYGLYNSVLLKLVVEKGSYNMSGASWDYTANEFTYDGTEKTVEVVGLPSGVTVNAYTNNAKTDAGTYEASVTLNYDTTNYNAPTMANLTWSINQATNTWKTAPAIADWVYGDASTAVGDATFGTEVFEYKVKGAEDSTYTTTKPTNVGEYTMRVSVATNNNFTDISATVDFEITKATPVVEIPTGLSATTGSALSSIALPANWSWKVPATIINANGNTTYTAVYTPEDGNNYVTVEKELTVNVVASAQVGNKFYATLEDAVANVEANNVQTTVKLLDNSIGNGLKILANQNIVFDLNGKTYTLDGTMVGSAGTETLGFQLMKGATVKFVNGTINQGVNGAKMMIQNYSNLILENVTLDATKPADGEVTCYYALSNNCGTVLVTGNTNIIADKNQVALDLYYGMSAVYEEGITVTFDANFTGSVKGVVEYGAANRVTKTQQEWIALTKLILEEGNTGTFEIAYRNVGKMAVTDLPNITFGNSNITWIAFDEATLRTAEYLTSFSKNVKLVDDINIVGIDTVEARFYVDSEMVLNLNGHNIAGTYGEGNNNYFVFRVIEGGKLTINGEGTISADAETGGYALYVDGGELIINNGTFKGSPTAVNVLTGTATINGGVFKCDPAGDVYNNDYRFTLNCYDKNYRDGLAHIVVNGGTFFEFNPENNLSEGANTNYLASGVIVTTQTNADGTYYVVSDAPQA